MWALKASVMLEAHYDSGQLRFGQCQQFSSKLERGACQPKTMRYKRATAAEKDIMVD